MIPDIQTVLLWVLKIAVFSLGAATVTKIAAPEQIRSKMSWGDWWQAFYCAGIIVEMFVRIK